MVSSQFPIPMRPSAPPEKELGYGQIFSAVMRRKHWLMIGVISGLAISGVMSIRQVSTYSSGMQVLIESIYQAKSQGASNKQSEEVLDQNFQVDSATQISFLQSSGLIKKAMKNLQSEYPEYDPDNPGSVAAFKQNLVVSQFSASAKKTSEPTKIFQVTYQSDKAEESQKVLSALQTVYLEYNREEQKKTA